jgi:hypothetical protein
LISTLFTDELVNWHSSLILNHFRPGNNLNNLNSFVKGVRA